MTISNLDDLKKLKVGLPILLSLVGIIFVLLSIVFFWNDSLRYQEQKEQLDWKVTNATVNSVEEEIRHSNTPGNYGHTFTYYDIHYDYTVDGQIYSGIIDSVNFSKDSGDFLDIKYNPNMPEKSTYILAPSKSFITVDSVLLGIGLILVILSIVLTKKNKKCHLNSF